MNKRIISLALALALMLAALPLLAGSSSAQTDPFQAVADRPDLPVRNGIVSRGWVWGNRISGIAFEPYAEGQNGQRRVVYYEKSRMEINNPNADPNSQFYISNGLLVREMIEGRIQIGNNSFQPYTPANITLAGDFPNGFNPNTPTFASLATVLGRSNVRVGQDVSETYGRSGVIGADSTKVGLAKLKVFYTQTGHNIADQFYDYLNQSGTIYEGGRYINGPVIDAIYTAGYPISEPYWTTMRVGGVDKAVMFQAFERRILTYTPSNSAGFRVEMGNVGSQYYNWRYGGGQPTPADNCTFAPAPTFANSVRSNQTVRQLLGCATDAGIAGGNVKTAYEDFQGGRMLYFYANDGDKGIYVLYNDGTYQVYADSWREGDAVNSGLTPPGGLYEPIRGFGKVWREGAGVRQRLGWASNQEVGGTGARQGYAKGALFYTGTVDKVIALLPSGGNLTTPNGTWVLLNR